MYCITSEPREASDMLHTSLQMLKQLNPHTSFHQTNTIKPKHTETAAKKDTTKPECDSIRFLKKNPLFSARRDNAPVSAAAPATTEKHQETTTQLNTPSLFNYCHIITAIYLHLLHRHQTNTHTRARARTCAHSLG